VQLLGVAVLAKETATEVVPVAGTVAVQDKVQTGVPEQRSVGEVLMAVLVSAPVEAV
jgi:hypothetical protein